MSNINKQALRKAAMYAKTTDDWGCDSDNFHDNATPDAVLALLDELDTAQHTAAVDHEAACSLVEENEELKRKLETAEKQIVALSSAANVNNHWKPDVCPITGRMFFMWIEHETLGYVPTYGGPFDSYTIPTRDSSGEYSCERYDHDFGGWREGECIGVYLTDDDEQCRVYELEQHIAELESKNGNLRTIAHEQNGLAIRANLDSINDAVEMDGLQKRIAELEARTVTLPDRKSELFWPGNGFEFDNLGYVIAVENAIRAAGIGVRED